MAKAITIVLLLAATAASAKAHPGLGKGGADGGVGGIVGHDANSCKSLVARCRTEEVCRVKEVTVCKEVIVGEEEVCRNVSEDVQVQECQDKCFTADKLITSAHASKGRRMLSADSINIMPHIAHTAINKSNDNGGNGGKTVCKKICRPATKTETRKVCNLRPITVRECKPNRVTECKKTCKCDGAIGNLISKAMNKGH